MLAVCGVAGQLEWGNAGREIGVYEYGAMDTELWAVDNLGSIGGHEPEVVGSPRVIDTDGGKAVEFDGRGDALVLDVNPLAGLREFTVEVEFRPDANGPAEQRFFHIQETGSENRVLLETRLVDDGMWYGDTYIKSGKRSAALNDPAALHRVGAWHTLALVCTGSHMTQYVNGAEEIDWRIAFKPQGAGRTSIGMRINEVHWFKGAVRAVRMSPRALDVGCWTLRRPTRN
ncbi:LamG-like jellyroll fold domain-containing protein [Verrucomicrobiota bacterium]